MAFLRSFGPLGFEIHIFCCYTLCLVYLAWQRARQPISATRDFSVQKPEVSGRISRAVSRLLMPSIRKMFDWERAPATEKPPSAPAAAGDTPGVSRARSRNCRAFR